MEIKDLAPEHAQIMTILTDPLLDPDIVRDSIESLSEQDMANIVDGFADHINDLKTAEAMNDKRAQEFAAKRDDYTFQISREKDALEKLLRLHGDRKVKTAYYSVGIQRNGGQEPVLIDADVKNIPADYLIPQDPKPNKDKIRELLKTKKVSWAHLGERGESLRIK